MGRCGRDRQALESIETMLAGAAVPPPGYAALRGRPVVVGA